MKAVEIRGFGAPEVLVLAERPDPRPGAGQVLVRVAASGVNRPDVLQRKGAYAPPPARPICRGWSSRAKSWRVTPRPWPQPA